MVFSRNHHTEKELQSNESEVMRKWEVDSEIAGNKKYQQLIINYELWVMKLWTIINYN